MEGSARHLPRLAGLDDGIRPAPPEVTLDTTPTALALVAERVFAYADDEPDVDHLEFDLPSVEEAIHDVRVRMRAGTVAGFEEMVAHCSRPVEVIAYFLGGPRTRPLGDRADRPARAGRSHRAPPRPGSGWARDRHRPGRVVTVDSRAIIEAMLFVAEEPLATGEIAEVLEVPKSEVEVELAGLATSLQERAAGVVLRQVAGGWRLYSHPDAHPYLERFAATEKATRLSSAALETLAVVAYRQPVSRGQVAEITGSTRSRRCGPWSGAAWWPRWARRPGRGLRCCTERPRCSSRSWGSTGSATSRRSPITCRLPRWWRRSSDPSAPMSRRTGRDRATAQGDRQCRAGLPADAEQLIEAGRVTVDGVVAHIAQRIDRETTAIEVDGVPLPVRPDLIYLLAFKPVGVVSTAHDPQGRPTVVDLAGTDLRVFPVGRLDTDSEGLILLTNDGDLTFRITHPSSAFPKTYSVLVEGEAGPRFARRLTEGVELDDGPANAASARWSTPDPTAAWSRS